MRQLAAGRTVFERTIEGLLDLVRETLYVEQQGTRDGLLQRLDPRAKVVSALSLLLAVALSRSPLPVLAVLLFVIALGAISNIPLTAIGRSLLAPVVLFASALALPALVLTPGRAITVLPLGMEITEQGLGSALLLTSRVVTAASVGVMLVLSTAWARLLRGLRALGLPAVVIAILSMTYRYIFLLLRMSQDMFVARKSRMLAVGGGAQARQVVFRTAGVLLARSLEESQRVYDAMVSRGFDGEVRLLEERPLRASDWTAMLLAIAFSAALIAWGRL